MNTDADTLRIVGVDTPSMDPVNIQTGQIQQRTDHTQPPTPQPLTQTHTSQVFKPRHGLPNGRAVVGALLVIAATVGSFTLSNRDNTAISEQSYLIATKPIASGSKVTASNIAFSEMVLPSNVSENAVSAAATDFDATGATAIHDIHAGDIVLKRNLVTSTQIDNDPSRNIHELALPVSYSRIVGRTDVGDRVTVLVTLHDDDDTITIVAAEDVPVIAWTNDNRISGEGVLTVATADAQSTMELAHLAHEGTVTVVRTTQAIADQYPRYVATSSLTASNSNSSESS